MIAEKDILTFLDEISFAISKMESVTQELKEARSSLGLASEARDMAAVLKIVSYAMLSDDETREAVKQLGKLSKDKNILDYVERFEDVQQKRI